jgi:hypothetical protein
MYPAKAHRGSTLTVRRCDLSFSARYRGRSTRGSKANSIRSAKNMAVVRRFALDLVRAHRKVKASVKCRRKLAFWDPEFLLQI